MAELATPLRTKELAPTRKLAAASVVALVGKTESVVVSTWPLVKRIVTRSVLGTLERVNLRPTSCPLGSMYRLTRRNRSATRRSAFLAYSRNRPLGLPLSALARTASVRPPAPRRGLESSTTNTSRLLGASARTSAALGGTWRNPSPLQRRTKLPRGCSPAL